MGAIIASIQLLSLPEDDMKMQAAKLLTNLSLSGPNRKTMNEKGMVAAIQKIHDGFKGHPSVKMQIMIVLNNCSFPCMFLVLFPPFLIEISDEESYEGLNFGLEEKMPALPADDQTERQERERFKEEEEQRKQDLAAEHALNEQRKEIEEEKKKLEEEELEKMKQLELEAKREKERLAEEELKKQEDEERRREAMKKKMLKKIQQVNLFLVLCNEY